jgi:ElaB/YqjD/DUF883 family membrane-anchored ribosome-binding protein
MKRHTASQDVAEHTEHLMADAKELLAATGHVAEEKVVAARKRLTAAIERAKEAWSTVQEKAVAGAKATDEAIREHPYQAIGIAFGVGAVVGYLLSRRDK